MTPNDAIRRLIDSMLETIPPMENASVERLRSHTELPGDIAELGRIVKENE